MAVSFRESGDAEKHQPIQIRVRERVQTFEYATETKRKTTSWCVGGMYVSVYQQYSLPGFFLARIVRMNKKDTLVPTQRPSVW